MLNYRLIPGYMAIVLIMALLLPLVGCGDSGETAPATSTSVSGQTLADIYSRSHYTGDVKYDVYLSSGGTPLLLSRVYIKGWNSTNSKLREEILGGYPEVYTQAITIWNSGAGTKYDWYSDLNIACQEPTGQEQDNPTENADQIIPTYLGTDTIDDKLCDVYQYASEGSTKVWIWKEYWFPIKMECPSCDSLSTMEYKNIVFGNLSDSLFTIPSTVQMQPYPCYPYPSIPSYPYST